MQLACISQVASSSEIFLHITFYTLTMVVIEFKRLWTILIRRNSFCTCSYKLIDAMPVTHPGHGIAQAVSRWLPYAADRVRAPVWSSGICGRQSDAGADFLRVPRFPLPIFIPPNSPSSQSPRAGTVDQKWPTCRVDPVWTPHPITRFKN
jgi:hypothetical protein